MTGFSGSGMGRHKQLPDHSNTVHNIDRTFFTEEEIEQIAVQFGFREDFPLHQELADQVGDYLIFESSRFNVPTREQKKTCSKR